MKKKIIAPLFILCSSLLVNPCALAIASENTPDSGITSPRAQMNRLAGETRFQTAKVISENYAPGKVQNVILATGNDFADALSASVIAHQKQAPILLVDSSVEHSQEALDYIAKHLDVNGTVYIIGGTGVIGTEFDQKLSDLGFTKVLRIAGMDRYDTSYQIACTLSGQEEGLTVVLSSGEQYPDALSISSFAANKGWPILLSPPDALPQVMRDYLLEKKPSQVYITGGEGVISEQVSTEIRNLLPQTEVKRLSGPSRFDTNTRIAETFALNPSTVYLATGYDFADALAGSTVAAQTGDPILFIDPSMPALPKSVAQFFGKMNTNHLSPNLVAFGGNGVVSDEMMKRISRLISGAAKETSISFIPDLTVTVTQNESFSLPTKVQAILYNSEAIEVPVQWNSTSVDTRTVGSQVFEGKVDGYEQTIQLDLTVNEPQPIAQYTTYFDSSQVNRTVNIQLAAKAIDGKMLAPGERFSFNETVGERTAEKGYKEAIIIEGDVFTPGLGGGICQVSSTLCNAVLLANLEIMERHPHSLPISYVPPGQDATVAWPVLDFKFRNSSGSYLLIRSFIDENSLTFKIYKKS